jgi:hypothetical protein
VRAFRAFVLPERRNRVGPPHRCPRMYSLK